MPKNIGKIYVLIDAYLSPFVAIIYTCLNFLSIMLRH